jgi:hypothetical protein
MIEPRQKFSRPTKVFLACLLAERKIVSNRHAPAAAYLIKFSSSEDNIDKSASARPHKFSRRFQSNQRQIGLKKVSILGRKSKSLISKPSANEAIREDFWSNHANRAGIRFDFKAKSRPSDSIFDKSWHENAAT